MSTRLPESLHLTEQWQFRCPKCGTSKAFGGRVAPRFSRKWTLGWCSACRAPKFFSVEPTVAASRSPGADTAPSARPRSGEGISLGIALGSGVGIAVGLLLGKVGVGVGVGVGAGLLLGLAFDQRNRREDGSAGGRS